MLGGVDGPVVPGSAVPAFAFPEQAAAVLGRAYAYGQWLASDSGDRHRTGRPVDPEATRLVIDHVVEDGRSEPRLEECRRLLDAYGIAFPAAVEATPATAVEAAKRSAIPVAIKAVRRRPGRSVRSGVALDWPRRRPPTCGRHDGRGDRHGRRPADRAGDDLARRRSAHPLRTRRAARRDRERGAGRRPGGGDRRSHEPFGPGLARRGRARCSARRACWRRSTRPTSTRRRVVDVIVQAAQLASDHGRVRDLDLNPVIASSDGAVVTDAVIRLADDDADGDSLIRKLV